jgi:hypothetical protein
MRYLVLCTVVGLASTFQQAPVRTNVAHVPFRVVESSGTLMRVDIGAERERARLLRTATVLTPAGALRARLVRTERVCEWLCGEGNEDGKECHFEAVLRASAPMDEAAAVLSGSPDIRNVAPMPAGTAQPVDNAERWIEAEPTADEERTYRWIRFPDGVFLTSQDMGRDFYAPPIDLSKCTIQPVAPFTILSCPTAELLYERSRGIAVSFADYGQDTVEPLLRFRLDGRDAVVIRLGLKAAAATALLVKEDDGRWRMSYVPFDYSLLC